MLFGEWRLTIAFSCHFPVLFNPAKLHEMNHLKCLRILDFAAEIPSLFILFGTCFLDLIGLFLRTLTTNHSTLQLRKHALNSLPQALEPLSSSQKAFTGLESHLL